jgi:MerR family transcriptional regulator, light-induced transcriptional regulator
MIMSNVINHLDKAYLYKKYMSALLEGDVRGMRQVVDDLLQKQISMHEVYRDFIQRGMYEVGKLWEQNRIPVSVEHLAATAVEVVLAEIYVKHQSRDQQGPEVMIACVSNELHDVGTMIIANLCESTGWRTILLGANTPTRDMIKFIEQRSHFPDLLALSITLPSNRPSLEDALAAITEKFPTLRILVGGQALDGQGEATHFREALLARFPSVNYLPTLEDFEQFLVNSLMNA